MGRAIHRKIGKSLCILKNNNKYTTIPNASNMNTKCGPQTAASIPRAESEAPLLQSRAGKPSDADNQSLDLLHDRINAEDSIFFLWRHCEESILDAENETRVLRGAYLEKQRTALDALNALCASGRRIDVGSDRFIQLARRLFGMMLYSQSPLPAGHVDNIARQLADSDTSPLCKAEFAVLHFFFQSVHQIVPWETFEKTRATLEIHADDDNAFSLLLIGILYCKTGEYKKAIDIYDKYSRKQSDTSFFHEMFCMEVSIAALYTREYPTCYGITESFRNTTELTGSSYLSARWKIHLVFLFLHMEKFDEALLHLDQLLSLTGITGRYAAVGMIQRALALYHFMNGRPAVAARILAAHAENLRAKGVSKPEFSDPLVLKMLYSLEQNYGISALGYELDRELRRAETGPCRLLKGVALRLRGQILLDAGEHDAALTLFRESFNNLLFTGDCEETLQCGVELAMMLKDAGNYAEEHQISEHIAIAAASLRQSLPHSSEETDKERGASPDVAKCIAQLALIPREGGFPEGMAHLVGAIQRSLSAQRAVLLRPVPGTYAYEPAGSSNLTPVELQDSSLRKTIETLKMEALRATPARNIILHDEGRTLGCALFVDSGLPWCLYMDNTLECSALACLSPQSIELLTGVVSAEIRGLLIKEERKPVPPARKDGAADRHVPLYWGEGMRDILEEAASLAKSNASVLIYGETGVGKERLARYIYDHSDCSGPFVAVNLACVPEHLFESELFGYEKGAFTGAVRTKQGLVELAQNGVLFLDEIGDIPLSFQIKLLRFLEEREFFRMGGLQTFSPKFRLIAATNRNLYQETTRGRFREDLYYRVAVATLEIPPLRARKQDIIPLAGMLYSHYAANSNHQNASLSMKDMEILIGHSWPGNVRELKNVVERAAVLNKACRIDGPRSLDDVPSPAYLKNSTPFWEIGDVAPSLEEVQFAYIRHVLRTTGGKIHGPQGALSILKMKKTTFYNRLKVMTEQGLEKERQARRV